MALTKCKECGRQISSLAKACPGCGAAPPKRSTVSTGCGCLLFGIVLLLALPYLVPSSSSNQTTVESPQAAPHQATVESPLPRQPSPQTPDQPSVIADSDSQANQPAPQSSNQTASIHPNSAAQASNEKYIPDLTAADVYEPLQEQEFQFSQRVDPKFPEQSIWTCKKKTSSDEKIVEIFGDSPTNITLVRITYHNTSARDTNYGCKQFMADAATLSYTGSQPDIAKEWVEKSVGKNAVKTIAGMSFRLTASDSQSRRLIITPASTVTSNVPAIDQIHRSNPAVIQSSPAAPRTFDLHIQHLTTKQVGNKWRYFFQITNNDSRTFKGKVTINLKRADGRTTTFETFEAAKGGMVSGGSSTVYTDAHTGPNDDYGEYKIVKFSYEWE